MNTTNQSPPKSKPVYFSIREGKKVRKIYIGPSTDRAVQLAVRSKKLHKAIEASERAKRSAEMAIANQSNDYLNVIAKVVSKWRFLEQLFIDQPQWGTASIPAHGLSDPYDWAGDACECLISVKQLLRCRMMSPNQIEQLCKGAAANDPGALQSLANLVDDRKELFAGTVDLLGIARGFIIAALAGENPATRSAVAADFDRRLLELGHHRATDALEKMLIEHAAIACLDSMKCFAVSALASASQQQAAFCSSMATQSVKRVQVAIESLEQYRVRLRRRAK